ncbi:MAG: kelch repeat-containing protein [Bacillota bacterium]|nr:kelch repeat-containing protein [Bacillota bacterium]
MIRGSHGPFRMAGERGRFPMPGERGRFPRAGDSRGASLVEVLAAVTIVAVLASVVAGAMPGVFPRARLNAWRSSMKGLQSACDIFYALWGTYPVTGEHPGADGPLASPLDLDAPGGDGRPFGASLRSRPVADAVEAGLSRNPAPLYYGVNWLGRVFATAEPPPWTPETVVFLPEAPGGVRLGGGDLSGVDPPGSGDGQPAPGDGEPPPGGEPAPGDGEPAPGGGGEPADGMPGGEPAGDGGVELVARGASAGVIFSAGCREEEGALVVARGPTLMPHRSLPMPVSGAGAALLDDGLYLLGGRGNADGILYQPAPERDWQLLSTRLPYPVQEATVATVGGKAYLVGGGVGEAGREVWRYEGGGRLLNRLGCSFPAPLVGASACAHGGRVYVFGGYLGGVASRAVFVLDPGAETIERVPAELPVALAGAPAVSLGDCIYIFGGRTPSGWSDRVLRYAPASGLLEDTGVRLPVPCGVSAAVALGGSVYLLGGAWGDPANPSALDTLWCYTPGEGLARLTPALAFAPGCFGAAGVAWGDDVYFCGGSSSPTVELSRVLRLRYQPGSPRPLLTLAAALSYPGVVAGRAGDLYVVGGTSGIGGTDRVRRVTLYDRAERVLGFTLPGRLMNAPCVRVGNRIFAFGGRDTYGVLGRRSGSIVMVDLDTGSARPVGSLPRPVEMSGAALWGDAVYVLGGCTDAGPVDRILRFDPRDFSVEEMPLRLPSPRQQAVAVSGPKGIWLVGGRGPAGLLDEVLLFSPADGSLRQVARLPVPLERAAAAFWQGRLYVMGGLAAGGPSDRILEVGADGSVREMVRPLPAAACGAAVVVDGVIYLVEDGGALLEVVPRPAVIWRLDGGEAEATGWRLAEWSGTGITLSFRTSPDGVEWTAEAADPAELPPGRYLEVKATFLPEEGARLESLRLARP